MTENQEPTIEANKTQSPSNANPATLPTESGGAATKPGSTSTTELKDSKHGGELIVPFGGPAPSVKDTKNAWPARWILSVPLYLAGLFLLLVTNVVLTTRPGVVTRDSKQFTDAMGQVWYPLVLAKQNTPRAAKRFVNRVRYLAMRQRVQRDKATWWERTLFPQRLVSPKRSQDATRIPEPVLVAMAALEQMDPEWIYDDKEFQEVLNGSALPPLAAAARNHQ